MVIDFNTRNPANPNAVPKRRRIIKAPSKATMIKTGKYV